MKRFRFGLEQLLRIKEQRERLAEARVAQARREVTLCQERVTHLYQSLEEIGRRLAGSIGDALPAESWAATFETTSGLERALRDAEVQLSQAEASLREAIQARTRISTEVEALETLREERMDDHRLELQRAEQQRLDEVGMRQWIEKLRKDARES